MGASLITGAGQSRYELSGRIAGLRGTRRGRVALYVSLNALVAVAYYAAGRLGLELAYLDGAVAALWPPAGLGLAALFLYGLRVAPGIVIGDLFLGDYSTPLGTVLGQTVGNTVALVAALVSAAFGPLSLRFGDVISADELGRVFRTWTLGDASGALVVAPVVLTWASGGAMGIRRRDLVEAGVLLVALVVLAELPPQRDVPYIV